MKISLKDVPGNLLGFLIGTNLAPIASAMGGPNIKPLASTPVKHKHTLSSGYKLFYCSQDKKHDYYQRQIKHLYTAYQSPKSHTVNELEIAVCDGCKAQTASESKSQGS